MIYNNPFIEINDTEYKLADVTRNKNIEMLDGYSVSQKHYTTFREIDVTFIPELITAWLSEGDRDTLKEELMKPIIEVSGLVLSPYFYIIEDDPQQFIPVLITENVRHGFYQIVFELEEL